MFLGAAVEALAVSGLGLAVFEGAVRALVACSALVFHAYGSTEAGGGGDEHPSLRGGGVIMKSLGH